MRKIITTAFLLLFVSSITVQAQKNNQQDRRAEMKQRSEQRMGPQGRQQQGPEVMLKKLNLNNDQEEEIRGIMLEGKKESLPLKNQLREMKARLRTLSSGDTYDVTATNKVVDGMSELQASMKKMHIAKKREIRALLDDDQKVMFDSMPDRGERQKRKGARNRR